MMGKTREIIGTAVASGIQILAGPIDLPIAIYYGVKNGIDDANSGYIPGVTESAMRAEEQVSWLPSMRLKKLIAGK